MTLPYPGHVRFVVSNNFLPLWKPVRKCEGRSLAPCLFCFQEGGRLGHPKPAMFSVLHTLRCRTLSRLAESVTPAGVLVVAVVVVLRAAIVEGHRSLTAEGYGSGCACPIVDYGFAATCMRMPLSVGFTVSAAVDRETIN